MEWKINLGGGGKEERDWFLISGMGWGWEVGYHMQSKGNQFKLNSNLSYNFE